MTITVRAKFTEGVLIQPIDMLERTCESIDVLNMTDQRLLAKSYHLDKPGQTTAAFAAAIFDCC